MPRIVAGTAGGRAVEVPRGRRTRPTSDRAREGLFSSLGSLVGGPDGRRVLDLYAGSGAVGLEAASRGAAAVLLVDDDPTAAAVARRNAERLGLAGVEVRAVDARRLASGPPPAAPYDVVFADPPYDTAADELVGVLADLLRAGWVADGGVLAVERASRDPAWGWPHGVEALRSRRYGEATLWYGRARSAGTS